MTANRLGVSLLMVLLSAGCATIHEKADFYGIKMRSERASKDFRMKPTSDESFRYSYRKSTMENEIYAYGHLEYVDYIPHKISSLRVTIINESERPISIEHSFAAFTLVTKEGERFDLKPSMTFYPANKFLKPKSQETFALALGKHAIQKEDIEKVICSFELGETQIILFPR